MRRPIPWFNFIFYGGLALISVVASIIVPFLTDELPAWLCMWLTSAGFVTVAFVVFYSWLRSVPDYTEDTYGVSIWHGDVIQLRQAKDAHKNMFDFFVKTLPQLIDEHLPETAPEREITPQKISSMLYGSFLQWTTKKISLMGIGWSVKDVAGAQRGKGMMVMWNGSMAGSALFHELFHMVDEIILGIVDYKHERKDWWALVSELKRLALQHWGVL
jgi:hypothetical protein